MKELPPIAPRSTTRPGIWISSSSGFVSPTIGKFDANSLPTNVLAVQILYCVLRRVFFRLGTNNFRLEQDQGEVKGAKWCPEKIKISHRIRFFDFGTKLPVLKFGTNFCRRIGTKLVPKKSPENFMKTGTKSKLEEVLIFIWQRSKITVFGWFWAILRKIKVRSFRPEVTEYWYFGTSLHEIFWRFFWY